MQSYRDLEVYQLAHELALKIHQHSLLLPKYELYETGSQIRKSSKSVSANIVEGYGRKHYKADFIRFLIQAHASCDETSEWLKYIIECHPDLRQVPAEILIENEKLGKQLHNFIKSVEEKHQ